MGNTTECIQKISIFRGIQKTCVEHKHVLRVVTHNKGDLYELSEGAEFIGPRFSLVQSEPTPILCVVIYYEETLSYRSFNYC
jgi:hypothetical protein